ncbi:MAG: hypothetical protein L6R40_007112 [Gallowayella cf. fulva]|nr:MAG: hypothetical protein L6R40_007112 [Xanthomendoza cf. fulva]
MASSGVNLIRGFQVLRYSALAAGLGYGFYRQSNLNAQSHKAKVDRDFAREQSLITQAKAEFKKKNAPQDNVTKGGESPTKSLSSTEGGAGIMIGSRTLSTTAT